MSFSAHILVWRLSAMGDVAMTVPVLKQLTKEYPTVKITVVSKPFFRPIFDDIPNLFFIPAEVTQKHKGVIGLYSLYKEIKELKITHVADLHNVLRSKVFTAFFKFSSTKIATINKGRAEKKVLTKAKQKNIKPLTTTHQRYADVFKKLGYPITLGKVERIEKPLSKKSKSITEKKVKYWIGIAPFAAFSGKTYPISKINDVINELASLDTKIFLFGGKEDQDKLETLEKNKLNTGNLLSKLSFKEELEVISNLDLMISMDSGNAHLAAMYGVPTITIWGVTHPFAGFTPYNQPAKNSILPDLKKYPLLPCSIYGNKVFKGYEDVMESIPPKKVVKRAKEILNKKEL